MHSVSEHIAYLVMHNDCVIVPQWGAFIASYTPACCNTASQLISPPCRNVAFNPEIKHNDGMLASSIVRTEGISYEDALGRIASDVAEWVHRINEGEQVNFPGIGVFKCSSGSSPLFTPQVEDGIANMRYMGLTPQYFKGIRLEIEQDEQDVPAKVYRPASLLVRVAASVAAVVALGAALFTTIGNRNSPLYTASLFNRPIQHEVETVVKSEVSPEFEFAGSEGLRIASVSEETGVVNAERRINHSVVETQKESRYYLIVASLASQNEVNRYFASIVESERAGMKVLYRDNRYRIYIANGDDFDEINQARSIAHTTHKYPDAWVYVRR